ncbi:MAG TPA: DUF5916 domain-containing protein [Candidatus Kapabacteria bacterium]|nr:DUF5916 domain-containing protein [Candidatus Kapabacteria bacterium]
MRYVFLLLLTFGLAAARLHSQPPPDPIPAPAEKRIVVHRIAHGAIKLDGRLDDDIWHSVRFSSDFLEKEPNEGASPTEETDVAFLYDDDALYVGARMHCDPANLQAIVSRRDNSGASERFIVSLDTYRDRHTAYSFSVTAAGVRTDYYHATDGEFPRVYTFDPVWEARVAMDSASWCTEMRIPFSQLRFNDQDDLVFGLNMDRYIPNRNEDIYWIPVPKNAVGWSSRMGELTGIHGIRPASRIEILPYVAGGTTIHSDRDPADPFDNGLNARLRGGLDAKMGLGPNLTLDATINPDFGQVEADPAAVNLSAFELIFDEQRPFFIEGNDLLKGTGNYFYSRRIGAPPHLGIDATYVDEPANTTILGAAKLTGRLADGTSVAGLAAVTAGERAFAFDPVTHRYDTTRVEPLATFGVARVQKEIGDAGTVVGLSGTFVARDLPPGSDLAAIMSRYAFTGGADWNIRFANSDYQISGHLGGSYVAGDTSAIQAVQQSSAHYFQRPDQAHSRYDPTRTSLAGYTAELGVDKLAGEHWMWGISAMADSPGLELNDIGRLRYADNITLNGYLQYAERRPGDFFHSQDATLSIYAPMNFAGNSSGSVFALSCNAQLQNFWGANVSLSYGLPGVSDHMTRGGPLMGVPWNWDVSWSLYSNQGLPLQISAGGGTGRNGNGLNYFNHYVTLWANVGDRLTLSLTPNYNVSFDPRQYVDAVAGGSAETYGMRYVFGSLEETIISARLRVSYALTPDLCLDAYMEPFVASGQYDRFGELPAPRRLDLRYYGTDGSSISRLGDGSYSVTDGLGTFAIANPDFRYGSFRSNFVLRWEWRPGSTFYLVWQQDRAMTDTTGERVGLGDLFKPVTAGGSNFITLKLSYWLPVG